MNGVFIRMWKQNLVTYRKFNPVVIMDYGKWRKFSVSLADNAMRIVHYEKMTGTLPLN
jgi:hypothetical protein